MEPLVSIIVPCFNSVNTIDRSVQSLVEQTYSNIEAILIDDGSTDNTLSVIKQYASKHSFIKVISQENSGKPAIARNKGLLECTGDIVCYLDADDTYHKDRISDVVNCFNSSNDISVVFHDYCIKLNDTVTVKSLVHKVIPAEDFDFIFDEKYDNKIYFGSSSSFYQKFLARHLPIHTTSISFKKNDYTNDLFFNESYTCYEDLDKWLYFIANGKAIYLDKVLSYYYDTENSVSKNKSVMINDGIRFYKRHYSMPLKKLSLSDKILIRQKLSKEYKSLAYNHEQNTQYISAIKNYFRGFYIFPNPLYIFWATKSFFRLLVNKLKNNHQSS